MDKCKENVIEMIDIAIWVNKLERFCVCVYPVVGGNICNYCKIERGLKTARACIIASVDKISIMRANMVAAQAEIEEKIKKLLGED